MTTENAVFLREWEGIRQNVLKGLKNLGHDIRINGYLEKEKITEEITFKTGDVIKWNAGGKNQKKKELYFALFQLEKA